MVPTPAIKGTRPLTIFERPQRVAIPHRESELDFLQSFQLRESRLYDVPRGAQSSQEERQINAPIFMEGVINAVMILQSFKSL